VSGLNIMTWNVRYFGHGTRGLRASNGWIRRLATAVAGMERAPDVLALQEVETRSLRAGLSGASQLERFAEELSRALPDRTYRPLYFPAHRYALGDGPALYTTGLAMLISDHLEVLHDNSEGPHAITHIRAGRLAALKQARIVAHVRLAVGQEALDLFNTHMSLPGFLEVGPHRIHSKMGHGSNQLAEVAELQSVIEECRNGEHAVLMGDLNTAPASPAYNAIIENGWIDAHASYTGQTPTILRKIATARFMHLRMHVDHVFATPEVGWTDFTSHSVDGAGPFAGLSDHAPKSGRLVLP
jgi:endonuclease/exonuclease/phosphatase family metal-dependent hydrolase